MPREKKHFQNTIYFVSDVITIFISYVIAVYFRYHILKGAPGLDTLATPYLLISFAYSLIISSVFCYLRVSNKRRRHGSLTVNAVGCLALLAFFYLIGELYFSRLALFFFWLISSLLLILKAFALMSLFDKRSVRLTKNKKILVVGDGELLFNYLRALHWDSACGFKVIGYVGNKSHYFLEQEFCGIEVDVEHKGWQGNYEDLGKVIEREQPDEVVFALENNEQHRLKELSKIAEGIPASLVPSNSDCIPANARLQKIDEMTVIDLSQGEQEKEEDIGLLGIAILAVFMVLILVITKFDIAGYQGYIAFDSLKCYLFGLMGFLLFNEIKRRMHGILISAALSAIIMIPVIVVFEFLYSKFGMLNEVLVDFAVTGCVLVISSIFYKIGNLIDTECWFTM